MQKTHPQILVVDDDDRLRHLILVTLKKYGHEAEGVSGGEAAIRYMQEHSDVLLVMECTLADMSGQAIIEMLRNQGKAINFIIATSRGSERVAVEMMRLGARDYLIKDDGFLDLLPGALERAFYAIASEQKLQDAETALRESEEKYRQLVESAPIGIFRTASQGPRQAMSVNQALAHILGCETPEEAVQYFTNLSTQLYVHPERRQEFLQALREHGHVENFDYEAYTADGRRVWLNMNARLARTEDEGTFIIEGFTTDITASKQAELALRKSQSLYQDLVETSQDLIWQCDAEGRYIYLNPAWETVFGYPLAEMLGRRFTDFQTPAQAARDTAEFARLLQGGSIRDYETVHLGKGGREIHLAFTSKMVCDDQGRAIGTRGTAYDITSRKKAEADRREWEQVYQTLFNNVPDYLGVIALTNPPHFLDSNITNCQMLGYTREELLRRGPQDFDTTEHSPAMEKVLEQLHRTGQATFETIHVTREGKQVPAEVKATVIQYRGEPAILSISRDLTARKQVEEKLRVKDWAIQSSVNAIAMSDLAGYLNYVNPAFLKLWGYAHESEVLGRSVTEFWQAPKGALSVVEALQKQGFWQGEMIAQREDGSIFNAETTASMVSDDAGKPLCMLGVFVDITDRKRAEEDLANAQAMIEAAFEQTPLPMVLVSMPDGVIRIANAACREILGVLDEPNPVGQLLADFKPSYQDYDADGHLTPLEEAPLALALQGRRTLNQERKIVRKDGSERWAMVSASPIYNAHNELIAAYLVFPDITQRKQAEAALIESEDRYRSLVENSPDIVYSFSDQRGGLYYSPRVEEILGYSRDYLLTHPYTWYQSIHPDDTPRIRQVIEAFAQGKQFDLEYRVQDSRGQWHWLRDRSIRRLSIGTEVIIDGLATDITERKRAEEEIRSLNADLEWRVRERTEQLEAVNKELEAFGFSVSHDLRAPVRRIISYSKMLEENDTDHSGTNEQHFIQSILDNCQHMNELIDDLLQLSRITQSELHRASVDISALAAKVADDLQQNQPERQVEMIIAAGVQAVADPRLLRIVLENLLGNAWKFTAQRTPALIEFGEVRQPGKPAVFFVRDNGAGFDMTYVDRLFGAFQRLHTELEFPGTGIGLATVQRIIRRHGGIVWAEGEVDKGATFYFTLG
jgi:PAS domain S-box-containing protein